MKKPKIYNLTPAEGQALLNFQGRLYPKTINLFETETIEKINQKKNKQLKLTEKETKHPTIRSAILSIINTKLRLHAKDEVYVISGAEYECIKTKIVSVEKYAPKKKDRYEAEIGKYMGKRTVLDKDE